MSGTTLLTGAKYRHLVAIRYLNASEELLKGMRTQCGKNDLHFLVTLRSFIEYSRRGIWFLAWAKDKKLAFAEKLTFKEAGSPPLAQMDEMVNEALGLGKVSFLMKKVAKINEPFLHCLHALTHGNPISVRMFGIGLDKIFQTNKLLERAEMELDLFRILVYRGALGEELKSTWTLLGPIKNQPEGMKNNAKIAAFNLKTAGGLDTALGKLP